MKKYIENQYSWLMIALVIGFPIWLAYAYIYQLGTNPIPSVYVLIFVLCITVPLFAIFTKMQTIVYDDRIEVKYSFGIIKRVFYFKDLTAGKLKKTPWYYGAGIRYYGGGTLYSINFTNAVEFRLKYQNKHIAIGSKSPTRLLENINKAIEQYNSNN